jgi:hypothetical protein
LFGRPEQAEDVHIYPFSGHASGSYGQFTANHSYKACWSDRMKREVKWSAVFQLVFQLKIKNAINVINQYLTDQIQITPAHHFII